MQMHTHTRHQSKVSLDSRQMKSHLRDLSLVFIPRLPSEISALKGGINNEVILYFLAAMSGGRENE